MVKILGKEVYKKKEGALKWGLRKKRKKETEGKTLREDSEQYYFLYKLSLLGRTCGELDTHLFLNTNLIFPHCCPRAKPSIVVRSLLLQILLIWARVERQNPLL